MIGFGVAAVAAVVNRLMTEKKVAIKTGTLHLLLTFIKLLTSPFLAFFFFAFLRLNHITAVFAGDDSHLLTCDRTWWICSDIP